MSYSRWSNSVWYTYADVNGGFTVCGEKNFSNEELQDLDACIKVFDGSDYDKEELAELRGYMELYCKHNGIKPREHWCGPLVPKELHEQIEKKIGNK